jgi:hypothetical protein
MQTLSGKASTTVVVLESDSQWRLGFYDAAIEKTEYCCTQELIVGAHCTIPNVALVNLTNSDRSSIMMIPVPLDNPVVNSVHAVC